MQLANLIIGAIVLLLTVSSISFARRKNVLDVAKKFIDERKHTTNGNNARVIDASFTYHIYYLNVKEVYSALSKLKEFYNRAGIERERLLAERLLRDIKIFFPELRLFHKPDKR